MIAVRAIDNVGSEVIRGQLGRNEDMVQSGTIMEGRVGERVKGSSGTSQGTVEEITKGGGER